MVRFTTAKHFITSNFSEQPTMFIKGVGAQYVMKTQLVCKILSDWIKNACYKYNFTHTLRILVDSESHIEISNTPIDLPVHSLPL